MAVAKFQKSPKPIELVNFLGLNESVGNTEIEFGECSFMQNFRITKNYKLQKRPGTHVFVNFGVGNVQGLWEGNIAGKNIMLICWNGNVYEYDMSVDTDTTAIADLITEGTVTIIGTITDLKTSIFWMQDIIYFLNGSDFKQYDGTTYQDIQAYTPTVALNAPPAGGGTLFEEINLLTGLKTQTFVGDGSSTVYQLAETNIDATAVTGTVNGVAVVEGVDFSVNRTTGQVTFTVAPVNLAAVSLTWDKVEAGNADLVKNHKYATQYGINNDTNLFLFGNPNEKHVFRFSYVAKPNYFPATAFVGVGSTEYAITDMKPQYQSLLVFKEESAYVINPTANPNYDTNTGLNPYNFGYQSLNSAYGNLAPNMVQLVTDKPVSFTTSTWRLWDSVYGVRNETEPKIISDRIKLSMQILDLSTAVTFDYEWQKELWVNIGTETFIWNYGNDTVYRYLGIQATEFIAVDDDIYYGSNGTVNHVNENYTADTQTLGDTIPCVAKLGFTDLGLLEKEKNMRDEWLAIEPSSRTSVIVKFVTDRKNEENSKELSVDYVLMDFNNVDFDDFSFLTNVNPQPKRLKGKIKKFTYLQTIFENDTNDETLTVLKLLLPIKAHRYSG